MKRPARALAALLAAAQVHGAATAAPVADPASAVEAAFVVLGPGGVPVARAITRAAACPRLEVDGAPVPMTVRAAPGTEPQRPTESTPANSKPSAFPVLACDAALPAGAGNASIAGQRLPLPPPRADRIVVIGDTGCRLKEKDLAWQACNDPDAYPFASIAAQAAAWHPDLVVHVGDYLYRENPCAEGHPGCAGSPWGYGWDAWQADFFAPARPLLEAAPWIVVRGNHESCTRGGQGWWRLLDPRPLVPGRDCNDPAADQAGNYSPAYAVPFGAGAQLVVMDLAAAGTSPLAAGDWRLAALARTYRELERFSRHARFTFAADHYPLFGVAIDDGELKAGNPAIQQAFAQANRKIVPKGVDVLLAGHIHLWQQADYGGRQPSQFVAGFSGTQEDIVPLPATLPPDMSPAPGVPLRQFNAILDKFGYMTLERTGGRSWTAMVYSATGEPLQRCTIRGRRSDCSPV